MQQTLIPAALLFSLLLGTQAAFMIPHGTYLSCRPVFFFSNVPCKQVRQKKHIVIVGWDVDHTVEGLLHGLEDFAPADSSVTIISPEKPDDIPEQFGACSFRHVEGSIASRQVLVEVNTASCALCCERQEQFACCVCPC